MPIPKDTIIRISQNFFSTEEAHAPITQVASLYPNITAKDGYQVMQAVVAGLRKRGHKQIGIKAGATSKMAQEIMGLTEPIYGVLFDLYQAPHGEAISAEHFIHPLLECEVAFKMGQSLAGPNVTRDDVLAATEAVVASFEIVDFRTNEWKIGMGEALCYNVFARHFVLGQKYIPADQLDLPNIAITLSKNGEQVGKGTGAAALGDPALAVAWVVNKLAQQNSQLNAGDIVLSGATLPVQSIKAGDRFDASFEGLETISVKFV